MAPSIYGALDGFAGQINANLAFPFLREGDAGMFALLSKAIGGLDVAAQRAIPNRATAAAMLALLSAAKDPGPINVFTYSGGAQAFATAFSLLPASITSRITNITYIAPGTAALTLPSGSGATSIVRGDSDPVPLTSRYPNGASEIRVECGHDISCYVRNAHLEQYAGSACSNPMTISNMPQQSLQSYAGRGDWYFWWRWWFAPTVTTVVDSTITYGAPVQDVTSTITFLLP
jgi:hypothetical protein